MRVVVLGLLVAEKVGSDGGGCENGGGCLSSS